MPVTKSVDLFIERSAKLLEARPDTAHVSITYGKNKKVKQSELEKETRKTRNFVNFKTYDPVSGVCIKTKTYKMKELSRLLNFLGPRGVQLTKHKKVSKNQEKNTTESQTEIIHQRGLGSFMTNTEFENLESTEKESTPATDALEPSTNETAEQPSTASKSSKKNKKKNKKR